MLHITIKNPNQVKTKMAIIFIELRLRMKIEKIRKIGMLS